MTVVSSCWHPRYVITVPIMIMLIIIMMMIIVIIMINQSFLKRLPSQYVVFRNALKVKLITNR